MAKKSVIPVPKVKTALLVPHDAASQKITKQIEDGNKLLGSEIHNEYEFDDLRSKYRRWKDYSKELLKTLFNTEELASELSRSGGGLLILNQIPLAVETRNLKNDIRRDVERLVSIHERLELFQVVEQLSSSVIESKNPSPDKKPSSVVINNHGTIYNPQIQQGSTGSSQHIAIAGDLNDVDNLLGQLIQCVESMSKNLPEETARQVKQAIDVLVAEVKTKTPRDQWCQISIDDLVKAAQNVGAIGVPVIELAMRIAQILQLHKIA